MNIMNPDAVIGTNAWGGKLYGKVLRGSYVPDDVLLEAMEQAREQDIPFYDMARDYGLGKAQKMLGRFGTDGIVISAKYTPIRHYKKDCVRKSLMKDLKDFQRDYVDVYWLHLPTDIEEHLREIVEIYKEGLIKHVGVSNFTLDECIRSRQILAESGIPLYGVQNHYSIICRDWEKNGLLKWCHDNDILFWGWAVLEEGLLVDPRVRKKSVMRFAFNRRVKKLAPVYEVMIDIASKRGIKVPQVAMAFCSSKGVVPMVGCRKPSQVKDLAQASRIRLSEEEISELEAASDAAEIKIMGADIFRPFVLKERKR